MNRRILYILLSLSFLLLALDRSAAYFHKPKPDSTNIVLYTTDWCPYCNSLRIHLENNSIPYTEHDTEKSILGIAGSWALRARGVPVSVIGLKVVFGYDINTINKQLIDIGYSLRLAE